MKHAEMRAILHNVADSLASGCSLLTGFYALNVFREASQSSGGLLTLDIMNGRVVKGQATPELAEALRRCSEMLPELVANAGGSISELREAEIDFWSDPLNHRLAVRLADARGRHTSTEYAGIPAMRVLQLDANGRLRPKPSRELPSSP